LSNSAVLILYKKYLNTIRINRIYIIITAYGFDKHSYSPLSSGSKPDNWFIRSASRTSRRTSEGRVFRAIIYSLVSRYTDVGRDLAEGD
jgi:hypothetical protein